MVLARVSLGIEKGWCELPQELFLKIGRYGTGLTLRVRMEDGWLLAKQSKVPIVDSVLIVFEGIFSELIMEILVGKAQ